MKVILIAFAAIACWYALQTWVLPRFGIKT